MENQLILPDLQRECDVQLCASDLILKARTSKGTFSGCCVRETPFLSSIRHSVLSPYTGQRTEIDYIHLGPIRITFTVLMLVNPTNQRPPGTNQSLLSSLQQKRTCTRRTAGCLGKGGGQGPLNKFGFTPSDFQEKSGKKGSFWIEHFQQQGRFTVLASQRISYKTKRTLEMIPENIVFIQDKRGWNCHLAKNSSHSCQSEKKDVQSLFVITQWFYLILFQIQSWGDLVPALFIGVETWLPAGPFLTFSACQQDVFHFLNGTPFFFSSQNLKETSLLSLLLQQQYKL